MTNSNLETIQKMVEKIKENSEIGVRDMQSWEIKQISHDEGYDEGYGEGYDEGHCRTLVEIVENARRNFQIDLEPACERLGITVEEYGAAKEALKGHE